MTSGSKVPSAHPTDTEGKATYHKRRYSKGPEKKEQTFRIKQIILARLRVEFPLHDIADLGMCVQRLWQDIETDTAAGESNGRK